MKTAGTATSGSVSPGLLGSGHGTGHWIGEYDAWMGWIRLKLISGNYFDQKKKNLFQLRYQVLVHYQQINNQVQYYEPYFHQKLPEVDDDY